LIEQGAGDEAVLKAKVRPMMVRLDSEFDPADYGFKSFSAFLGACSDVIGTKRGEFDEMIFLKNTGTPTAADSESDLSKLMKRGGMCLLEPNMQSWLLRRLHSILPKSSTSLKRTEIVDRLNGDAQLRTRFTEQELPRSVVSRLVQTVSNARCFKLVDKGPPIQLALADGAHSFEEFRTRHNKFVLSYASRNGVEMSGDEWGRMLYGDDEENERVRFIEALDSEIGGAERGGAELSAVSEPAT
jgi:hypothetical protein